jgi:hypothetical protein
MQDIKTDAGLIQNKHAVKNAVLGRKFNDIVKSYKARVAKTNEIFDINRPDNINAILEQKNPVGFTSFNEIIQRDWTRRINIGYPGKNANCCSNR